LTNYIVQKKFLEKNFFKKIQNLIINIDDFPTIENDFSWFYRDKTEINKGYFTHAFFNKNKVSSPYFWKYIEPILIQLKAIAVVQIRANMLIFKNKKSKWHTDYLFKCKTGILYLNNSDGGTELKINNKKIFIKSEANKMLIFDSKIKHRAISGKNFRYILNFNYFN
tara:strand:+ start:744 stop:1244 length:501 start_codon:yes stop_codon:yes gene_type:complete